MDKQNQIVINCTNLNETLEFFTKDLGFRLDVIFPADAPTTAIISGYGKILQLQESAEIESFDKIPLEIPDSSNEFVLTKNEGNWHTGRAGMQYRDLIPSRLGGKYIASHIRIEKGGKVPDYVHFHKVRFQMIYCLNGWAKLVYEDQGAPFLMNAGDCVLQPPEIRHRVLECSDNFEVLEIGCPAIHPTFAEHEFDLPTENFVPDRIFNGQKFVHHIADKGLWTKNGDLESCDTGISKATNELADVQTLRAIADTTFNIQHSDDFLFYFVKKGNLRLSNYKEKYQLNQGCSFVLTKNEQYLIEADQGLELIRVSLPK
ncbi:MAG TPA: cupin domain-containing protein [Pyrinomonadaceae bacterium]|nr:cupin domain-containing protein [Pyrinomonadaceae bacterium]